jgi:O-antigen/teichoic acid export membrane protein
MSLKGILKMFAAFFMSQGVSVVNQLLVPPMFLRRYPHGVEMYGEWVALTAAVSYLGTLNFGIQNYANNQMTLLYNRGEQEAAKTVQSSALRLILIMVLIVTAVGASILFMPVARWMGLRHVSSAAAAMTLFLMALQLVATWFFAFLSNSYQVIGELHRGANWQNVQRLTSVFAMAVFLWMGASFPVLALTQLASMVLYALIVLVELRIRAPILLPSLRYGNRRDMIAVLKPSAYYGLYAFSAFFCWQGPVLLIQKILGPAAVAVFALTRVVFNMSRQLLIILTYSIGQETIKLIATRSWAQLRRMYDLSERVVLALTPVLTVGVLLACPAIFTVWLRHDRTLYEPGLCMLMAAVSAIMGIREHKYAFQNLSNEHEGAARFSLVAYAGMIVAAALTMKSWGVDAFMIAWLAAELAIAVYVIAQNRKLFPVEFRPSLAPLPRIAIVLVLAFAAAAWPARHDGGWSLTRVVLVAIAGAAVLSLVSFFIFGLRNVQDVFVSRFRRRFAPSA